MRITIAIAVLALLLPQGACSRKKNTAQAETYAAATAAQPVSLPSAYAPDRAIEPPRAAIKRSAAPRPVNASRPVNVSRPASASRPVSPSRPASPPPQTAEQRADARLEAARAKAERLGGVHMLGETDIEGLSYEQIRELRGY